MRNTDASTGFVYGLSAYVLWGTFPLFFHLLKAVPATEILLHRVIWTFIFVALILLFLGWGGRVVQVFRRAELIRGLFVSSVLVSVNWLVFIWAVTEARVVESSLGYFLTPLVSVFLARVFLKESLHKIQLWAILIAAMGVLWLVVRIGYLPWVSLLLAMTFGLYGLVRKKVEVDTLTGLTVETALLLPFAIMYGVFLGWNGDATFSFQINSQNLLLIVSGMLTALPLLLFASAAKRLSLTVVGFMMYINPSLQFIFALFILNEPFVFDQLIGFCFIWSALIIFTYGSLRAVSFTR